jgi:translocation and assembly module TamA
LPLTYAITKRTSTACSSPLRHQCQVGGALLPVLTDERFVRVAGKVVWYHPLGEKAK